MCLQWKINPIATTLRGGKEGNVMKKANITLSEADIKLLEELKEFFGAKNYSDVLKRSLVQTSHLTKYVDDDGNIKVKTPSGETLLVPKRW